jgi:O-antigen/teichoic acid export membrane protein
LKRDTRSDEEPELFPRKTKHSVILEQELQSETRAVTVGKESLKSSVVLLGGNLISTAMLAATAIIIARLLGPAGYGEYTLALVLPGTFVMLTGFGLNTALTRYSAYHLSRNEIEIARRKSKNAALVMLLLGAIFTFLDFVSAPFFSVALFHRPELTPLVQLASISILGQAMLQAAIAGFIGWASAGMASLSTAVQAFVKLSLSPFLILLGLSVFGAVIAHSVSFLCLGVASLAAFYALKLRGGPRSPGSIVGDVKQSISYGLPEYVGRLLFLFSQNSFLPAILGAIATDITVANYTAATNIATILWLVPWVMTLALMPAFARLHGTGGDIRIAFSYAQKYASYIVTPIVIFIIGASSWSMEVLYGSAYLGGSPYLQLLCVAYLPYAFGLAVIAPLMNGIAKTKSTLLMYAASSAVLFALAPVLGLIFGLKAAGLIVAFAASNFVQLAVGMLLARREGMSFEYGAVIRSMLAACLSYAGTDAAAEVGLGATGTLLISMVVFFPLYLTLAPLMRVLRKAEFSQLMDLVQGIGVLTKVIRYVMRYEIFVINRTSIRKFELAAAQGPRRAP